MMLCYIALIGVFHSISLKHLERYAGEAAFRWNKKAKDCLARMSWLIRNGNGRRLPYAVLTA